jgi:hypothetical protein
LPKTLRKGVQRLRYCRQIYYYYMPASHACLSLRSVYQCTYSIAVINQCTYGIAVINQCTYSHCLRMVLAHGALQEAAFDAGLVRTVPISERIEKRKRKRFAEAYEVLHIPMAMSGCPNGLTCFCVYLPPPPMMPFQAALGATWCDVKQKLDTAKQCVQAARR